MSKWKMVKIKEVCEKASSNIAQKDICENDGEYPIYGASGFIKTVDFYVQEEEYIGIVKDGAGVGRVMVLPAKSSVTGTIQYIIPNEKVLVRYLANILTKLDLGKLYSGATIPHIYFKNYENIKIPLPPIEEQKRIADILEKASNLIDMRKQQLEKMDLLIKSKFIDMFGDPVTNSKGWEVKRLSEICQLRSGGTPPRSNLEYFKGKIPWITTVSLGKTVIDSADAIEYITETAIRNSSTKLIPANSLLFGMRVGVGKVSINAVPMCTNQDIMAIIDVNNEEYNNVYLKKVIDEYATYFHEQKRGATIKGIKSETLANVFIPAPPISLQNKFTKFVEQVEKQKAIMQQSLGKMETNYNALMQEYFG